MTRPVGRNSNTGPGYQLEPKNGTVNGEVPRVPATSALGAAQRSWRPLERQFRSRQPTAEVVWGGAFALKDGSRTASAALVVPVSRVTPTLKKAAIERNRNKADIRPSPGATSRSKFKHSERPQFAPLRQKVKA